MMTETVFVMHGQQQSSGEPGMRDQRRTARSLRAPIAVDFVPDNPVGTNGVEHGQEADVVCLLANTPFITLVVLGHAYWRQGTAGLNAERLLCVAVADGEGAPDGFGFAATHVINEGGRVCAMLSWDVESRVPLPHPATGLSRRELSDFVDELVVMARVSRVDLPVPDVFELRVSQGEILDWDPLCVVDTGR